MEGVGGFCSSVICLSLACTLLASTCFEPPLSFQVCVTETPGWRGRGRGGGEFYPFAQCQSGLHPNLA